MSTFPTVPGEEVYSAPEYQEGFRVLKKDQIEWLLNVPRDVPLIRAWLKWIYKNSKQSKNTEVAAFLLRTTTHENLDVGIFHILKDVYTRPESQVNLSPLHLLFLAEFWTRANAMIKGGIDIDRLVIQLRCDFNYAFRV